VTAKRVRVIIVGGGQAGLSASHFLRTRSIEHLILERGAPGDSWRRGRWDSFRLITQNWQFQLPGLEYSGPVPDDFMSGREVAQQLEQFAERRGDVLRSGVTVDQVRRHDGGSFAVETAGGTFGADNVVIAAGPFHRPRIPASASYLAPGIAQLHSSAYRNPQALAPGGVLVIGSGQSGWQIARELHRAGRPVHWSLGRASRWPRRYRGRDLFRWLAELGIFALSREEHPAGELVRREPKPFISEVLDDGPEDPRRLAREGMVLHGRLGGCSGEVLRFAPDGGARLRDGDLACAAMAKLIDTLAGQRGMALPAASLLTTDFEPAWPGLELDLRRAGIATVIWATGYDSEWRSWIALDVFDPEGYPRQTRGVTREPGLFFVGLDWMHTWGSGLLYGVAGDAAHVVEQLAGRDSSR